MAEAQMSRPPAEIASPLRYTFTPGIHSTQSIQTMPGAACTLRPDGELDPKRSLKAYAGPDGVARFHVRPSWECEEIAKLVIESVKDGKATHYPLHLRSSRSPTEEMPAPPMERSLAHWQMGRARPPLSVDEAVRLTDPIHSYAAARAIARALRAGGAPPRRRRIVNRNCSGA
jgi:hypothetical protein